MNEIKEITDKILEFRDSRDWEKFHEIKNLLLGINIEVSELQSLFLWDKGENEVNKEEVKNEIADIFIYLIYICDKLDINLQDSVINKLEIHKKHYPIDISKGKTTKYNKL